MLMGTGGNAGSQASITVIRAIALKEAEPRDVFRVLWKELRVAVCLAITVAAGCFVKLLLIDNAIFGYDYNWLMSLAVAMSLLLTIVAAKIIGCLLPMLAVKLKLDPAVVASPFITTIVDALSLLVYVQIASLILAG
jgi:magnesium transporter